ncbi:hypothetical protein PoB_003449100 [Plakobranchus ocellatus]|uniref:Uncharacterized protein n=1 Tax=Plakobranchus ocellatus TaxID=259542 RepID=A0AAV4AI27_9GAST|nr:hypothetical protein PoB_003449100 [Plakobranchus ocellatus]
MFGAPLVLMNLLLGLVTAQQPTINLVTNSSSFSCTDEYLVVGEDFVTLEVDVSGNNSHYTYTQFQWPQMRRHKLSTVNGKTTVTDRSIVS